MKIMKLRMKITELRIKSVKSTIKVKCYLIINIELAPLIKIKYFKTKKVAILNQLK